MPDRITRLEELFKEEISKILQTLKDPGLAGLVTLTGLRLTRDLKNATVFYSVLGTQEDRECSAKALSRSQNYIRSLLWDRIRLKFIPSITFEYDRTPEKAERVERILDQIHKENEKTKRKS
ncbi:MAG: 30S ribosome-binding factor RbfA [Elusimicrobia bacterium]|nr:30S ribosome-binding factor RbfA [Elusimicrobiota bacterium]